MNRNILKIASSHFPVDTDGNIFVNKHIIEEFAKAIIRECADVCSNVMDYHGILEKFGVEE